MDATDTERARCRAIVELVMLEVSPEAQRALIRCLNMIATGAEPITMREQVDEDRTPAPGSG
jgi:hypothetical protein